MPKSKMGCWCPIEQPKPIMKIILVLYVIAIILLMYITLTDGSWIVYVPTILIVGASLLVLWNSTYGRK